MKINTFWVPGSNSIQICRLKLIRVRQVPYLGVFENPTRHLPTSSGIQMS